VTRSVPSLVSDQFAKGDVGSAEEYEAASTSTPDNITSTSLKPSPQPSQPAAEIGGRSEELEAVSFVKEFREPLVESAVSSWVTQI